VLSGALLERFRVAILAGAHTRDLRKQKHALTCLLRCAAASAPQRDTEDVPQATRTAPVAKHAAA
jgi:hypothetical protein